MHSGLDMLFEDQSSRDRGIVSAGKMGNWDVFRAARLYSGGFLGSNKVALE